MSVRVDSFLSMLARGQDSALLRFSLGNEYLAAGDPVEAALHLQSAVDQDRNYSAAWKLLGKAHAEARDNENAIAAYTQGVEIAEENGVVLSFPSAVSLIEEELERMDAKYDLAS